MEGFQNLDATVNFCHTFDHLFDFLNSMNPFGKRSKSPIHSSKISHLEYYYTISQLFIYFKSKK